MFKLNKITKTMLQKCFKKFYKINKIKINSKNKK